MRSVAKKFYMSILTFVIILFTMVATTYAWVGILTSSSLGSFNLNLKVEDTDSRYSLKISTNGVDFKDSISLTEIQKCIMTNKGIDYEEILSGVTDQEAINAYFSRIITMQPVTTSLNNETNLLNQFQKIDTGKLKNNGIASNQLYTNSEDYFKFDLYLAVEPKEGIQEDTFINASVFFADIENTFIGTKTSGTLVNSNLFESLPSNDRYASILKSIPSSFTVDSANACRLALSLYQPIDISSSYVDQTPIATTIYQGGKQEPSYKDNVYNLGGILPEEYNLALKELNSIYHRNLDIDLVPTERTNDLELVPDNKVIWVRPQLTDVDSTNINYLGIANGVRTKMKISVYFWFEGWDADCMRFINFAQVGLDLKFSTDKD